MDPIELLDLPDEILVNILKAHSMISILVGVELLSGLYIIIL